MLEIKEQRPIPTCLSHHTTLEACKSILSDDEGKGICFYVVSNKHKNDDQEIKMGEKMFKRVRDIVPEKSLLNNFRGYEDSASLSFMEGESTIGMMKKYGHIRMEFDLRNNIPTELFGYIDCEYVSENNLEEYINDYCVFVKQKCKNLNHWDNFLSFLMLEIDIMLKVFSIKEEKWREEKEWRIIEQLKEDDSDIYLTSNGKPYKKSYFSKDVLIGITILYDKDPFGFEAEKIELENYLKEKGYNIPIKMQKVL